MVDRLYDGIKSRVTIRERKLFILSVCIGLVIHFVIYAEQLTNPDGRWMAGSYTYRSTYWETALGRWGIYFVDCTRGFLTSPIVTISISIIGMSVSGLALLKVLDVKGKVNSVIIMLMMITMPCFSYTLSYWYCADAYTYAMLFSILAVWFAKKQGGGVIGGAVCFACMLGLYQAYLGVTVGLCMICLVVRGMECSELDEMWWKEFRSYIVMGVLGLSVYWMILQSALLIWHTQLSAYSGANEVGIRNTLKYFPDRFLHTYHVLFQWLFGDEIIYNTYWKRPYLYAGLIAVFILTFIYNLALHQGGRKGCFVIVQTVIVMLLPAGISVIEIVAPERDITILQSAGMCLIIPFVLKLTEIMERKELLKLTAAILSLMIVWSYILSDNATYLAVQTTQRQTETVLRNIYNRIEQTEDYCVGDKVLFGGYVNRINYPRESKIYRMSDGLWSEMNSYWGTYGGSTGDWRNLYFDLLGMKINICSKEEYMATINSEEFLDMPLYPASGSVQKINGIVCVKLMENPPTED